jgi:[acyl-carrier-protein] S-malonyltransferase
MSAALFPGQGVQGPGMDGGLVDARPDVFEAAGDVLGIDVAELCRTGTTADASLDTTLWAQPAVLVCSVASFEQLRADEHTFTAVAGHSVGEYAALVACGALKFEDAVSLIAARARITADVAHRTDGAMAALLRVDLEQALDLCREWDVALAGDNAPGQCVISGEASNITHAIEASSVFRAVARRLEVEGAFHSPLMAPAAAALGDALSSVEIERPTLAFWSSTTASKLDDPEAIRRSLVDQLTSCVRWRETVAAIGATDLVDVGPGRVVGALARRIVPEAEIRFADDLRPAVAAS